jgi:hypothetical protein
MKLHGGRWGMFLGLASTLLALVACGGGGGGGGAGSAVPASYTGLTSQAVLSTDNAATLASGVWEGGMIADGLTGVVPLSVQPNVPASGSTFDFTGRLRDLVLQALPAGRAQALPAAVVSDTLPGDCGGSAGYTMDVNEQSGAFSGQFSFNDYCSLGTVIAGVLSFSGQGNPADGSVSRMQLVFNNLRVADASFSGAVTEGTASFVLAADGLGETATLDYVLRDNNLLKTAWVNNYVAQTTYGNLADQVMVSGRYYDGDFGFVDLATLTPLTVAATPRPTGGSLLFTGQASQARLTFHADQSTLLEVDGNNDGLFEVQLRDSL